MTLGFNTANVRFQIVEYILNNPTLASLVLLNIFDMILHVVIDRVEPVRISGNIIVIFGALFAVFSTSMPRRTAVAVGLVCYAVLNGWYVVQSGIGVVGAGLIAGTIALSVAFLWRTRAV